MDINYKLCVQWYSASEDLYGTTDRHLQFTGRHKRPPHASGGSRGWIVGGPRPVGSVRSKTACACEF